MATLELNNIRQIKEAKVTFGDLTIFVGNQATGKSMFLQMHKLTQDIGYIKNELSYHGFSFDSFESFLSLYFGEGMENIWKSDSSIKLGGKEFDLREKLKTSRNAPLKNFYIPA